jgi:peptide/nickel transport system substrate-binding protein
MKSRAMLFTSIIMVLSIFLTACQPASTPTAPTAGAGEAQSTAAQATEAQATPGGQMTETSAVTQAPTETTAAQSNATTRKGGWLDEIDFSAIADPGQAISQLQAGAIDAYPVTGDNAQQFDTIKNDPNLSYTEQYGSFNQLLFNTVACKDTNTLNPFTDMKMREAMNWAIDRNYIAQEIFGGLATPKYTILTTAFPDYARYSPMIAQIIAKYGYNLDKAKQVVTAEMQAMGATQGSDGKWQFKGKPVTINGLIRTEDKRKDIGDYFSSQLEKLGFTVNRLYKARTDAAPIWQGDPSTCGFTFYTAGWISPAISRDEGNMFAQYSTGRIQDIPLFKAFKPSADFDKALTALQNNDFATMDDRQKLFETALTLGMQESWWGVLVNDNISFEPFKKNLSVVSDLAGGINGTSFWPYTLRVNDKEGGTVKIAQSAILVQPWNPIAGSNWIDDSMIYHGTEDYGAQFDPYTGIGLPQRVEKATVLAKQGLPITKSKDWVDLQFTNDDIKVPGDAWVDWDAAAQKFITADQKSPSGITAKTKVTVTYPSSLWQTKWHDGSNLSMGDFIMYMILTFDQAKKESKIYDESVVPTFETFMQHFKGLKIVSTDPLTIETYDDLYYLDAEVNAAYDTWYPAYLYGQGAWHNLAPAIAAEADGKIAFSTDKAQANKVEWTSLISGPSLATQKTYLDQLSQAGTLPYAPTMSQYVKPDEAKTRYDNLEKWYTAHGHLWLGTGPYYVDKVFPVEGTITLKYNPDFPDPADRWSGLGQPKVAAATIDGPGVVKAGDTAEFDVTITFQDQPYKNADLQSVTYLVFDSSGNVVATGDAAPAEDGHYKVTLTPGVTDKLTAGSNKLTVAIASKVVSIPTFASVEFVTQ